MPGVVIDLLVDEGDEVEEGQTLLILESMKMHNEFKSPRQATVKDVRVVCRGQPESKSRDGGAGVGSPAVLEFIFYNLAKANTPRENQ